MTTALLTTALLLAGCASQGPEVTTWRGWLTVGNLHGFFEPCDQQQVWLIEDSRSYEMQVRRPAMQAIGRGHVPFYAEVRGAYTGHALWGPAAEWDGWFRLVEVIAVDYQRRAPFPGCASAPFHGK